MASNRDCPSALRSFANSTIRIAFFADRPMIAISPTRKYTSFGMSRDMTARTEPMAPRGTTSMTEIGIDQLS